MAYKIKINKRFKINSQRVYLYLVQEWSYKVADEFLEDIYSKIYHLAENPFAGVATLKYKNVRKLVISKHNKVFLQDKRENDNRVDLIPVENGP